MDRHSRLMEKLCTLTVTACFGGIMVGMYAIPAVLAWWHGDNYVPSRSLLTLLAPWIQKAVFLAGVMLLVLFLFQLFQFLPGAVQIFEHFGKAGIGDVKNGLAYRHSFFRLVPKDRG